MPPLFFKFATGRGTVVGRFPFDRIPLNQSSAGIAEASLDRGLDSPRGALVDLTLEEAEPLESFPVTMEVSGRPARDFLDVDQILAIRGLVRPGDEWAQPTGRFVQYSRAAQGSGDQVVLQAATFFGGEGHENFKGAAFSPSGDAIWAVANLAEVDWTDAPQFYPDGSDAAGETIRRETGVIIQYSDDLARLTGLLRFPESSLSIERIAASPEGKAVYISGSAGHQFSQLAGVVGAMRAVRPAGQMAGSSGTAGAAYDDGGSFIARLQPDGWLICPVPVNQIPPRSRISPNWKIATWPFRGTRPAE